MNIFQIWQQTFYAAYNTLIDDNSDIDNVTSKVSEESIEELDADANKGEDEVLDTNLEQKQEESKPAFKRKLAFEPPPPPLAGEGLRGAGAPTCFAFA